MFNTNFLKELTILYVEDDEAARNQLARTLNRLFKNVILASNGLEGLQKYEGSIKNNMKIDLILSDVNMPKLNGIEMLEKIRLIDKNIPIIYTTARSETEFLLKAIDLHADHYALKPINLEDIIIRIQKVCEKRYFQNLIDIKNRELKQYLSIINNVAAIIKMNDKGEITFLNSHFLDTIKCEKKDLINKNFEDIIHKDTSKDLMAKMWEKVKNDEVWDYDIKYLNKEDEIFYIYSTVFKVYIENRIEYINIGFLSTKNVNEKREFRKNIIENIKTTNQKANKSKNEIEHLKVKNNTFGLIINKLKHELKSADQKNLDENNQIKFYENELLNIEERLYRKLTLKNTEIELHVNEINKLKLEKKTLLKNGKSFEEKYEAAFKELQKLEDSYKKGNKRIFDLNDLLEHRESQLKEFDPSLVFN